MNREAMIDQIVEAYMDSIMCANLEDWIENVLRYGRKGNGFENMTDEELKAAHREHCEDLYEEDE